MKKRIIAGFVAILAVLNVVEGFSHLTMASISWWGIITNEITDIRVMASPIEAFVFGIFSIFTGIFLGHQHHHHNHFPMFKKKEKEEKKDCCEHCGKH